MLHHSQEHPVDKEKNGYNNVPSSPKQRVPPRRGQIKKRIFGKLIKALMFLMAGRGRSGGNGGGGGGRDGRGCLKYSASKTSPRQV
ncbi:hypothetical protein DCAR_0415168 [Daucus carota subsp. sativus]|uniref:Uncharacterized protein n=1 Tax=Daucus carota subsp. sativus TaxID=79200 RepID=A0A165A7Y9_DAUCS|nr:hypothetical protein DCAR_0415168 [Daucus carota subsp. sativus]